MINVNDIDDEEAGDEDVQSVGLACMAVIAAIFFVICACVSWLI